MSLLSALYTGVSGLQTFGDTLQVIGDNIANVSTVGFKSSRAEFADVLSQTINVAAGRSQMGRGVTLQRISPNFSQGSFSNSDRLTDLGINGNGFFIVTNANGERLYTRNGQLTIDKDGSMVTSSGEKVMGYQLDSNNNNIQVLSISHAITKAQQTKDGVNPPGSGVKLQLNLNAKDPIMNSFQVANPASTSNFSTSMTVYDSLGTGHTMDVYFNKTADNAWAWHGLVDGGDLTGGTAGAYVEGASGTLAFNGSGALQSSALTTSSFNFKGTNTAQTIGFNFGTTIATGGAGLDGSTQFGNPNVLLGQSQDGYTAGNLNAISIDAAGVINGSYSNGQTIPIAQLALANFRNLQGLHKTGAGIYAETTDSGPATANRPGLGGLGNISAYSLELSNVDLATEFVSLISTQRAYQANSKIITVGDQLLSDIVNIIR